MGYNVVGLGGECGQGTQDDWPIRAIGPQERGIGKCSS